MMLRKLSLAIAAVVVLSACGGSPDVTTGDVSSRGQELFAANCAACHGPGGTGTTSGPPLVHIIYEPSHHGDESFYRAVREGVTPHHWDFGPMPAISGLTDDDIAAIVDYIREQQRDAGIE